MYTIHMAREKEEYIVTKGNVYYREGKSVKKLKSVVAHMYDRSTGKPYNEELSPLDQVRELNADLNVKHLKVPN